MSDPLAAIETILFGRPLPPKNPLLQVADDLYDVANNLTEFDTPGALGSRLQAFAEQLREAGAKDAAHELTHTVAFAAEYMNLLAMQDRLETIAELIRVTVWGAEPC